MLVVASQVKTNTIAASSVELSSSNTLVMSITYLAMRTAGPTALAGTLGASA